MPKVSVIIPTYNRSQVLIKSIQSVLVQTLNDLELIVVDDGSTDDTRQVVEALTDRRLRYFCKPNGGPADARNVGLDKARGDYIAFLDHDDRWPDTFLDIMVAKLESHRAYGLVYAPIVEVYPDDRRKERYRTDKAKSGWIAVELFKGFVILPSACLIRKDVLSNFYYDPALNRSYEDGDFFLRLSVRCQFLFTPDTHALKSVDGQNYSTKIGIQPTRLLILNRFLYELGGEKIIPKRIVKKKLSLVYRKLAKNSRRLKQRKAAISLFCEAIRYNPFDLRLYGGLARALLIRRKDDKNPQWEMPAALTFL